MAHPCPASSRPASPDTWPEKTIFQKVLTHRSIDHGRSTDVSASFEASPSYLWNWAHDRSYEVARDLRRRGVKAMVLSVRMDSYLNQCDRKEGRTAPKARNLQITP